MKNVSKLLILFIALIGFNSFAQASDLPLVLLENAPIEISNSPALSESCEDLASEFEAISDDQAKLDGYYDSLLFELSDVTGQWYRALSPYEGRTVKFPLGYFWNIRSTSYNISDRRYEIYDLNLDNKDARSTFLEKLSDCLVR